MPNILIIEDEFLISNHLERLLNENGYHDIFKADTYVDSIKIIKEIEPDLLLIDIQLFSDKDAGLRIAQFVEENYSIPFIFLTGQLFEEIIKQAKLLKPANYIIKPFVEKQLLIAIDLAIQKDTKNKKKAIFVKGKLLTGKTEEQLSKLDFSLYDFVMKEINIDDIVIVQSFNHNKRNSILLTLKEKNNYFLIGTETIENFLQNLTKDFIQIHKSFVVNKKYISTIRKGEYVEVNGCKIPIGQKFELNM